MSGSLETERQAVNDFPSRWLKDTVHPCAPNLAPATACPPSYPHYFHLPYFMNTSADVHATPLAGALTPAEAARILDDYAHAAYSGPAPPLGPDTLHLAGTWTIAAAGTPATVPAVNVINFADIPGIDVVLGHVSTANIRRVAIDVSARTGVNVDIAFVIVGAHRFAQNPATRTAAHVFNLPGRVVLEWRSQFTIAAATRAVPSWPDRQPISSSLTGVGAGLDTPALACSFLAAGTPGLPDTDVNIYVELEVAVAGRGFLGYGW